MVASNYAFKTLSKLLDQIPQDEKLGLEKARARLQTKILIISPAIDLIELISARGNTSLASTQELTKSLKHDIDDFDRKVETVYELIESSSKGKITRNSKKTVEAIKEVRNHIDDLLYRIEEAIPLISLALTTSGANLSSSLPNSVSPGKMLQAANFLTRADELYDSNQPDIQVGPTFSMKLYTIFYASHRNPHAGNTDITWKEEYAKCHVSLWRRSPATTSGSRLEYNYDLVLEEDLRDDRYHEENEKPRKMVIDVCIVTRLFFSASGRLLEIEESNSPVLVLKLNEGFRRSSITKESDSFDLTEHINDNVEWIALEMYNDEDNQDSGHSSQDEKEDTIANNADNAVVEGNNNFLGHSNYKSGSTSKLVSSMESMNLQTSDNKLKLNMGNDISTPNRSTVGVSSRSQQMANIEASLSLLEYLIRLSALQANDQESIYEVHDERLSLYLRDEAHGTKVYGNLSDDEVSQFESPRSRNSTPPANRFPRMKSTLLQPQQTSTPNIGTVTNADEVPLTPWEYDRLGSVPVSNLRRELYNSPLKESPLKMKSERRSFNP